MKVIVKKLCLIFMCIVVFTFTTFAQQKKAEAVAPLVVAGGAAAVEIGALALWGGAVLVAAAGVAVGMDEGAMNAVENWGKSVWDGANDAIKASWSAATSMMSLNGTGKASINMPDDVQAYLNERLPDLYYGLSGDRVVEAYGGGVVSSGVIGRAKYTNSSGSTYYRTHIGTYKVGPKNEFGEWMYGTKDYLIREIHWSTDGSIYYIKCTGSCSTTSRYDLTDKTLSYSISNITNLVMIHALSQDVPIDYSIGAFDWVEEWWNVDSSTITLPVEPVTPTYNFNTLYLPHPVGTVGANGDVTLKTPTVGRVGNVATGEIAASYTGTITEADALTTAPTSTTNPTVVTGEVDVPILGDIWEWLKAQWAALTGLISSFFDWFKVDDLDLSGLRIVTTQFPFSLPWDVDRLLKALLAEPKTPAFEFPLPPPFTETINISMESWDDLMPLVREFMFWSFVVGFIYATRRLFGGGV